MTLQQVHLRINDAATGQPTPVRLRITDADGTYYAPFGRLTEFATGVNQDVGGNVQIGAKKWAYIDGTCEILLPPGTLHVEITKGPEYKPIDEEIMLLPGKMSLRFTIERWCDMRKNGWYSGDTRVHFLSPDAALLEGQAEDVAVVNLLITETHVKDDAGTLIKSIPNILSFSGQAFARQANGGGVAVNTLNHRSGLKNRATLGLLYCHRIVYPLAIEANEDNWTVEDWCDQCHRKKGLVVSRCCGASTDFRSWETLATLIRGSIDAIEVSPLDELDWSLIGQSNLFGYYYDLFNKEIIFPLVGASCKTTDRNPIGSMRTFAFIPFNQELNYANWIEAVRAGRTFVSNGPLLSFTINGEVPALEHCMPLTANTLHLRAESKGGERYDSLELLWNGKVIQSVRSETSFPFRAELNYEFVANESGWLAARCVTEHTGGSDAPRPLAHSSPVAIRLAESPRWARSDAVRRELAELDKAIEWARTRTHPARPRLLRLYEEARTIVAKKLS